MKQSKKSESRYDYLQIFSCGAGDGMYEDQRQGNWIALKDYKQLKEENEILKNQHKADAQAVNEYIEQLKKGIRDSIEWLELNKEMYPENWVVEDDETVKDLKELLNNKNKEG